MASKQQAQPDLGLLDMSIDDIDDLPGFAVPPNGVYTLKLETSVKLINDKNNVEAAFEVIEVQELDDQDDEEDPAAKPGTKFSVLCQLGNEIGEGKLKEMMLPIAAHFGERNMLKLVTDTCKKDAGVIISAQVKRRQGKGENADRIFANVSNVVVA